MCLRTIILTIEPKSPPLETIDRMLNKQWTSIGQVIQAQNKQKAGRLKSRLPRPEVRLRRLPDRQSAQADFVPS